VLRHPDRPATQPLILLGKLTEVLGFTKLAEVGQLDDRQVQGLGENRGSLPGPPQGLDTIRFAAVPAR
jgi:hypothetical protein